MLQTYPSHQGCFCFSLCDLLMVFLPYSHDCFNSGHFMAVQDRTDPELGK